MVFDNLLNCENYYGMHKNMEIAFDFIKKAVNENLAVGKYEISGKDVYASIQEYTTGEDEVKKFEGHKNYLDIQFILSGHEEMKVAHISKMTLNSDYNAEKDVEFYKNTDIYTETNVTDNEFCIFLPQDIHKPGLSPKCIAKEVKKVLVKIKM